jgi:hypothetical protein
MERFFSVEKQSLHTLCILVPPLSSSAVVRLIGFWHESQMI